MSDPFNLARFETAQTPCIGRVRAELQAGRKETHWMWFVFPQVAGLGSSRMAEHFAISGMTEAAAYLGHPVLGPVLLELTGIVVGLPGGDAEAIFGSVDSLKFRSSMTLFRCAAPGQGMFQAAIRTYFGGIADDATLTILRTAKESEAR